MRPDHNRSCDCSRRQVIRSLFTGSMLFPAVLQQMLADTADPLAPHAPHFPGKAKRVIFMYSPGGVSHLDSYDYKPQADRRRRSAGKSQERQALPAAALGVQASRRTRARWSANCSPHIAAFHGRNLPDPIHARRSPGSFSSDARNTYRIGDGRAAEHRIVGELRAGHGESESAVVRGAGAEDALHRRAGVVVRFSPRLPFGNAGEPGRGPGARMSRAARPRKRSKTWSWG